MIENKNSTNEGITEKAYFLSNFGHCRKVIDVCMMCVKWYRPTGADPDGGN